MPTSGGRLAWPLTFLLAPVLAAQGALVRRGVPRLPEAPGPRAGLVPGAGEPLRLAVLGESTAAGVGAATQEEAMAGRLARAVAVRTGRPVGWQVAARSGINTRTAAVELVPLLGPADAVVVVLGVNELLELNRPPRFARELRALAGAVRARIPGVPILLAGMPPVGRFPALPQPLRAVMGAHARALDRAVAEVARDTAGTVHAAVEVPVERGGLLAADGFHPSAEGYRVWAEGLADALVGILPGASAGRGRPGD